MFAFILAMIAGPAFGAGYVQECPGCQGDLDGNNAVQVQELLIGVNSFLKGCPEDDADCSCPLDGNNDNEVHVQELLIAVHHSLKGCPPLDTPTETPTVTPTEVPPTETVTEVPATEAPTDTPSPTETATEIPPTVTATAIPPTDTPTPEATNTPGIHQSIVQICDSVTQEEGAPTVCERTWEGEFDERPAGTEQRFIILTTHYVCSQDAGKITLQNSVFDPSGAEVYPGEPFSFNHDGGGCFPVPTWVEVDVYTCGLFNAEFSVALDEDDLAIASSGTIKGIESFPGQCGDPTETPTEAPPTATYTSEPTETDTPAPPTATDTPDATETDTPEVPTTTPTATLTVTPEPPTETPTEEPTETPVSCEDSRAVVIDYRKVCSSFEPNGSWSDATCEGQRSPGATLSVGTITNALWRFQVSACDDDEIRYEYAIYGPNGLNYDTRDDPDVGDGTNVYVSSGGTCFSVWPAWTINLHSSGNFEAELEVLINDESLLVDAIEINAR